MIRRSNGTISASMATFRAKLEEFFQGVDSNRGAFFEYSYLPFEENQTKSSTIQGHQVLVRKDRLSGELHFLEPDQNEAKKGHGKVPFVPNVVLGPLGNVGWDLNFPMQDYPDWLLDLQVFWHQPQNERGRKANPKPQEQGQKRKRATSAEKLAEEGAEIIVGKRRRI